MPSRLFLPYRECSAVIDGGYIGRCLDGFTHAVIRRYPHNMEGDLTRHSWILPRPVSNCERPIGFRPRNGDDRMHSHLVVVVVALVLVQLELTVGAGIDTQFDWAFRLLLRILNFRPQGHDRPRTNE